MGGLLQNVYAVIAMVTMVLGFLASLLFAFALLAGGPTGETVAVWAGDLMKWGIRLAALAMLIGLIYIYFQKKHSLTIDTEKQLSEDIKKGV